MADSLPPSAPVRPDRPTIAQIREVCQPPTITGRRNSEHWVGDLYHRPLSPYLTRVFLRAGFSANGVTGVMILIGWCAAASLLIPGLPGGLLAAILGQLQMLIDCTDGEVARWRCSQSPTGVFLDKIAHYTTEAFIAIALGVRAAGGFDANSAWILIGALLAVVLLLNKSLNDFVHVARAYAGLPKVSEAAETSRPRGGLVARLRRIAGFVPFYKVFHSIELTLLALVAAVIDAVLGDLTATRVLVAALLPLAVLATIGHFIAIMSSSRLRATA
ncbi:MAG: CDP-alcohol phosphatidyltransferase family protein [Actinomycetes bacterium]